MFGWGTRGNPRLSRRVSELEERCENLERRIKGFQSDMDLQWEKVSRGLGRLAKRAKLGEDTAEGAEAGAEASDLASGLQDGLTARQRFLNAQILASRGGRA